MVLETRNERKGKSLKRFFNSFKHSFAGLDYTVKNEQSILVMTIATIFAVILGITFKITPLEWVLMVMIIGIVLSCELLNTAVEAVVDLVSPEIHPLAKIAKDTASAAVFICSLISFIIACFIFIPKIIEMGW